MSNKIRIIVIDRGHPKAGQELTVKMVRESENAVVAHNGDNVDYWLNAEQIRPTYIPADDSFLQIVGAIRNADWDKIRAAVNAINGCVVGGGWTSARGDGVMNVNAHRVGAGVALPLVQAAVEPWGLAVNRSIDKLLGMEVADYA